MPQKAGNEGPVIVGLGELVWDCCREDRQPGGAPANMAFHANQLGARGVLLSRIGADDSGRELLRALDRRGLEVHLVQQDPGRPTGTITVEDRDLGEACYSVHTPAAWDALEATEAWMDCASSADAICFGTLAQRGDRSRRAIQDCVEACQGLRVLDVNLRQSFYTPAIVRESLGLADVVKMNEREALVLAALLEIAPLKPDQIAAWMLDQGARLVCITRAGAGCVLHTLEETLVLPTEVAPVVDPGGAGDAFTAALITGLLRGVSLEQIGRQANQLATRVAAVRGSMPAIRELPAGGAGGGAGEGEGRG